VVGDLRLADHEPPGACFLLTLPAGEHEDGRRPKRDPVGATRRF
jgi:hypothetical protein